MKDQYFGDVNDYRKYGLLRILQADSPLRMLVAWMLTPGDERSDGRLTSYLEQPGRWERFDPELYRALAGFLSDRADRGVGQIEGTDLIPSATYFSELVPDDAPGRRRWVDGLRDAAGDRDLVFLDPDNGIEVKSRPPGRSDSSKYVYWSEIEMLWSAGVSLLIYQHIPRVRREEYVPRLAAELERHTSPALVRAFVTPSVLFLLAGQERHAAHLRSAADGVSARWGDQIRIW